MNPVARQIDFGLKHYEKLAGINADYNDRTFGVVNPSTGDQTITDRICPVKVWSHPLSSRERVEFSQAGLTQIETRWGMRSTYGVDVKARDQLTVGAFIYEVMQEPAAQLDEFQLQWTFFARRLR